LDSVFGVLFAAVPGCRSWSMKEIWCELSAYRGNPRHYQQRKKKVLQVPWIVLAVANMEAKDSRDNNKLNKKLCQISNGSLICSLLSRRD